MKINYISQINNLGENNKQVKQIIEDSKKPEEDANVKELVVDDMSKQENDFKSRLKAKRQRKSVNNLKLKFICFINKRE
jgi:hypothetical protein